MENVATLWPATGFVLGVLLVTNRSSWGRILFVSAVIQIVIQLDRPSFAVMATLANTLGPVLEIVLIQRFFPKKFDLDNIKKVLIFFGIILASEAAAALIGAGGLGNPVVQGLNTLEIGLATIGGLSIVLLAMVLDRITQGIAQK